MTLFTKKNCGKCEYVKDHVDLDRAGVTVKVLSNENYEALAELAWHELVTIAETTMPILVLDNDASVITGAVKIKNYLLDVIQQRSSVNC